jgi:hypothetical protein
VSVFNDTTRELVYPLGVAVEAAFAFFAGCALTAALLLKLWVMHPTP